MHVLETDNAGNDSFIFQATDKDGGVSDFGFMTFQIVNVPDKPVQIPAGSKGFNSICQFNAEFGTTLDANGQSATSGPTSYDLYNCVYDPDTDFDVPGSRKGLVKFEITDLTGIQSGAAILVYNGSSPVTALDQTTFTNSVRSYSTRHGK